MGHRDEANALLTAADADLERGERILLVVFDAFDRLATDWATVRQLTIGALQVGLRLRSRRAVRAKFFIRPDLEEDDEVWRFSDSSKLRHAKVDLAWGSADLYGLVFMDLGNDEGFGERFRQETGERLLEEWRLSEGAYLLPHALRHEEAQREMVERLADRQMGGGPKRGYTYSWVPLHLADATGRISPPSYLLAFKRAAEHTSEKHPRALSYRSIQQGVVRASEVRVDEINEDYPRVRPLLEAVRGAVVPISVEELADRWSTHELAKMENAIQDKLPPRRYANDQFRKGSVEALVDDLVELAVLYRTRDGRLNMPDIFRVGFGIRRKGGVKPPR